VMRGEITLPPRKHPVPDHILTAMLKGLQTDAEDRHDSMDVLIDALTTEPDNSGHATPWLLYVTAGFVALTGVAMYYITVDNLDTPDSKQPRGARGTYIVPTPMPKKSVPVIPPVNRGTITDEQVDEVVKKYHQDIDDCIDQGRRRDAGLVGHVFLKFDVVASSDGKKGEVEKVRIVDHDLFDHRTARCVRGMATGWEFPAPSCPGAPDGVRCKASVSFDVKIPESSEATKIKRRKKTR